MVFRTSTGVTDGCAPSPDIPLLTLQANDWRAASCSLGDSCPSPAFQYHPTADSQALPTTPQFSTAKHLLVASCRMPRGSPSNSHNGTPDFPAEPVFPRSLSVNLKEPTAQTGNPVVPGCLPSPQPTHQVNPPARPPADLLTPPACLIEPQRLTGSPARTLGFRVLPQKSQNDFLKTQGHVIPVQQNDARPPHGVTCARGPPSSPAASPTRAPPGQCSACGGPKSLLAAPFPENKHSSPFAPTMAPSLLLQVPNSRSPPQQGRGYLLFKNQTHPDSPLCFPLLSYPFTTVYMFREKKSTFSVSSRTRAP